MLLSLTLRVDIAKHNLVCSILRVSRNHITQRKQLIQRMLHEWTEMIPLSHVASVLSPLSIMHVWEQDIITALVPLNQEEDIVAMDYISEQIQSLL